MFKPPKKLLPMLILEILKENTDSEHTMTQKDIIEYLKRDYDLTVDRKAVSRNIGNLIDMDLGLQYSEITRGSDTAEENTILTDFYIEREFTDAELRLLIDSILFSKNLPQKQRKELLGKLEKLSNKYFKPHIKHIKTLPDNVPQNPQLFYTLEILDEAITLKKKVKFKYLDYRTDKKLHPKENYQGNPKEYVVSPYQMVARESKYYLICNYDKYNDISNYRVDRISDIAILDESVKPFDSLEGSGGTRLDLSKYMAEHIYMYSGKVSRVTFIIGKQMISDVLDMFGMDVLFLDETDYDVTVQAYVSELAVKQFAKSFAPDVLILAPKHLADEIVEEAKKTIKAYNDL